MQTVQRNGGAEFKFRFHFMIGIAGGDFELAVRRRDGEHAPGRRHLRKHQSDPGAVRPGLSIGGVVNLKDDIGTGADQFRLARLEFLGRLAGRVTDQKVAGQLAGVGICVGFGFSGNEGDSGFGV